MKKPAITQVPIDATLAQRWSGRAYDANKSVSKEHTIALLEAARWAPSCMGDQPWRIVVFNKAEDPIAWQKAFDCLVEGNQVWVKNAPWLSLICADSLFTKNSQANPWAEYDTGAAAQNLCLQATSMGLMAHQLGGFDAKKAREVFNIPERYVLKSMISVGYPVAEANIPAELHERETAPRSRRALGELFFDGTWSKSIV